ncbi:hypothetical protein CTheo_5932 [Ceratobasidium theobromae]|uniref:Uncharacterized protein n=1 Tax=Ceratobasidium theobromae TaxID=1582974 RepID=A0A5N5QFT6_9AGAM|nr:hypothetical protein CTheo_5932 [Ceratobasidium theobromae]
MAGQPRDYRRMLYRLDRATKYESIPALVQHMMDETVLDGILELRMITSSVGSGSTGEPTQLRLPSTFISFRREGREVNAVALYGPRSARTPSPGQPGRPSANPNPNPPDDFTLEVKKRYAPRTTLVWVFSPLVQRLLNEGASTVLFECRSYLAGSDVAREVRAADAAAAASAALAAERESQHQQQQQAYAYSNQHAMYDQGVYQWQQDQYAQAAHAYGAHHSNVVAPSAWNPNATYQLANTAYLDGYGNPVNPPVDHQALHEFSTAAPAMYAQQRSPTPRGGGPSQARGQRTATPSPLHVEKEEDPAIELLHRRAPFKRMLGYAGKQHNGSVEVYELADEVAAIAFTDGVSGIAMAGVEAMGAVGRTMRKTSPPAGSGSSPRRV